MSESQIDPGVAAAAATLTIGGLFRHQARYHPQRLALQDADAEYSYGELDFVDRRKYLIKSGGENIYPAEIERVLLADPRIADAVVVRGPDARWGEVPVAFVVPAVDDLTAEDVLACCRGRIAGYKMPKGVRFVTEAELPRSTTGKIQRHELEAQLKKAEAC